MKDLINDAKNTFTEEEDEFETPLKVNSRSMKVNFIFYEQSIALAIRDFIIFKLFKEAKSSKSLYNKY